MWVLCFDKEEGTFSEPSHKRGNLKLCICVYAQIYMCICVYVYRCTGVYVYMCICAYVHMCICVYVYMCKNEWVVCLSMNVGLVHESMSGLCDTDGWDALRCRSFLAKEPLIIGLFCRK